MPVNVERILEQADATLKRLETERLARLREIVNRAYAELAAEIRRRWPIALEEAAGQAVTFQEARARQLLAQLQPYVRALELSGSESGATRVIRDMVTLGATEGAQTADELLAAYARQAGQTAGFVSTFTQFDPLAVEAAVANSQARLTRHSAEAIRKIEDAVVRGLIRGEGVQKITRSVREAIKGDSRIPEGGLYWRAETIARTELQTARGAAARQRYIETGVDEVQWYATLDERVCPYCAARHGNVYPRDSIIVPAHPNCRCYAAPFRREWLEDDLIDVDYWKASQAEIKERAPKLTHAATPFEREQGREYPQAIWTPSSGLRA